MLTRTAISAATVMGCLLALNTTVQAQPNQANPTPSVAELATRRQLIQQAMQEADANHHERALELAEQASQIQTSASLLLVIAEQQFALGRFGDALGSAERCAQLVRDPQHVVQDRVFVTQHCDQFVQTLPQRAGRVTVLVPANAPEQLQITVANRPISRRLFNLPNIVNPGQVQVRAEVSGRVVVDRTVTVSEGAAVTVPITLPASIETTPIPTQTPVSSVILVRPVSAAPLVVLGVGVAALGSSLGLLVARNGAIAQLESGCDAPDRIRCQNTMNNRDAFQTANTLDTATSVVFGIGVAVTVGGAAWLIIDRVMAGHQSSTSIRPQVSLVNNSAIVGIGGAL